MIIADMKALDADEWMKQWSWGIG